MVTSVRADVTSDGRATVEVRKRGYTLGREDLSAVHIVPLNCRDTAALTAITRYTQLPQLLRDDQQVIAALAYGADVAVQDAWALASLRRFFLGGENRAKGAHTVAALEPTLIVVQSKGVWRELSPLLPGNDIHDGDIALRRVNSPVHTLVAKLSHPTAESYPWQEPDDWYFRQVVRPSVATAVSITRGEAGR